MTKPNSSPRSSTMSMIGNKVLHAWLMVTYSASIDESVVLVWSLLIQITEDFALWSQAQYGPYGSLHCSAIQHNVCLGGIQCACHWMGS